MKGNGGRGAAGGMEGRPQEELWEEGQFIAMVIGADSENDRPGIAPQLQGSAVARPQASS